MRKRPSSGSSAGPSAAPSTSATVHTTAAAAIEAQQIHIVDFFMEAVDAVNEWPEENVPQRPHHPQSFLEQRRWGKRPLRRRRRNSHFPLSLVILPMAMMLTSCLASDSDATLEERRQFAHQKHQQLFQQPKNQQHLNRHKSQHQEDGAITATQQQQKQQQLLFANTQILPGSAYERLLLLQALAEHKSVEEQEIPMNSNQPVIIHLPPPPFRKAKAKSNRTADDDADQRRQLGELLFQAGTHESLSNNRHHKSSKNGESASSIDDNHGSKAEERRHFGHNPIRPQSAGINNAKWQQQQKRLEFDKIVGIGNGNKAGYSTGNTRELPVNYELEKSNKHRIRRPSSAEMATLKGQTASIFLPVPSRRTNGQILRPIQPINAATTGNTAYLKRIHASGGHLAPGAEEFLEQQELLDRRFAPPASAAAANTVNSVNPALAAISQLFSNGGAAGAQPPQAPLAGSPFDLFASQGGAQATAQQTQQLISQLPNPLQILSQGSTLEQITNLAKNLLQMSNGNQEILSTLTKALTGSPGSAGSAASKLTSSAVGAAIGKNTRAAGEKTAVIDGVANNSTTMEMSEKEAVERISTLFSSYVGKKETVEKNVTAELDGKEHSLNGTLAMLNGLPTEQRQLLEAALRNGELDAEQAEKFIAAEKATASPNNLAQSTGNLSNQKRLVNAESRLMEWIQQNRPRPGQKTTGSKESKESKDGTNENGEGLAKDWLWANSGNTDKLPYFGRYCGSFVEQTNSSNRNHNIAGALWAVDERRLLVTKFRFIPIDSTENISFWAGPANLTGTSMDFFPGENGYYLSPLPLDAQTFALKPVLKMEARVRVSPYPVQTPIEPLKDANNKSTSLNPPEREWLEDDEVATGGNGVKKLAKRNLYNEMFGQQQNPAEELPTTTTTAISTVKPKTIGMSPISPTMVPIHFGGTARNFHLTLGTKPPLEKDTSTSPSSPQPMSVLPNGVEKLSAHQLVEGQEHSQHPNFVVNNRWQSLGWHGGVQPLLLTLPEGRLVKTLNWLSLWDHNQKQATAVVMMPTGVSFQVPSTVQLRPLPSSAIGVSGIKRLQSGPIRVLDTKTIEVTEFMFRTEGLPAWFMVGKEIMPNAKGHIVPVFDKTTKTFDCDSLREFHNETVILRLPDPLDIKDVFWFAIFSIPRGIPLSHIYIPYNDMQLPPDLSAVPTPQCIWNPSGSAG